MYVKNETIILILIIVLYESFRKINFILLKCQSILINILYVGVFAFFMMIIAIFNIFQPYFSTKNQFTPRKLITELEHTRVF